MPLAAAAVAACVEVEEEEEEEEEVAGVVCNSESDLNAQNS